MPVLRCPHCGKPNPDFIEVCQYCDGVLTPPPGAAAPSAEETLSPASPHIVRCPACGKPNPPFVPACQFCDALLPGANKHDTIIGAGPRQAPADPAAQPNADADTPDWLRSLRTTLGTAGPGPDKTEPAHDEPDWLWAGAADSGSPQETPAEDLPDWLQAAADAGKAVPAEAEPDWMWGGAGAASDDASASHLPANPAEESEAIPVWLRQPDDQPQPPQPPPTPAEPAETAAEEPVPDWLSAILDSPKKPPAGPPAAPMRRDQVTPWHRPEDAQGTDSAAPAGPPKPDTDQPPAQKGRRGMMDWLTRRKLPDEPAPQDAPAAPARPTVRGTAHLPLWLQESAAQDAQESTAPQTPQPAEDAPRPDWLRPVRRTEPLSPPGPAAHTPPPADDAPEWLRNLRGTGTLAPEDAKSTAQPAQEEDVPDWLRTLRGTGTLAPEGAKSAAQPAAEEELPDWLRTLRGQSAPPPEAPAAPAAPAADETIISSPRRPAGDGWPAPQPEEPMPDWLRTIVEPGQPADAAQTDPAAEQADSAVEPAEAPPQTAMLAPQDLEPPPAADIPDWLQTLRSDPSAPAGDEILPPQTTLLSPDTPGAADAGEAAPEDELPDWLRAQPDDAGPGAPQTALLLPDTPGAADASEAAPEDELPYWLQTLRSDASAPAAGDEPELPQTALLSPETADTPGAAAEPPTSEAAAPTGDAAPDDGEIPPLTSEARGTGELPDWLTAIRPLDETLPPEPEPAAQAGLDADTLAWLSRLSPTAEQEEPLPDWLTQPALASDDEASPTAGLDEETLAWLNSAGRQPAADAGDPSWMDDLNATAARRDASDAADDDAADDDAVAVPAEEVPDWLRTLRDQPAASLDEAAPEWLRALRGMPAAPADSVEAALSGVPAEALALDQAAPEADAPASDAETLIPADLPAWLEAMRPVAAGGAAAEEADAYEERVGVLAGMRGVLRAEPVISQPHAAMQATRQLNVTETHLADTKLLAELADAAEAPAAGALPARARKAPLVERWLVFLVFGAAILLAQFGFSAAFPPPDRISPDARRAFDLAQAVPASQPVLLIFEYEPAHQGELNAGALAVTNHLMRRGVLVAAVSTRPGGAAVAQQVLAQTAASLAAETGFAYQDGGHYLNLGYLPGGAVGVHQFAGSPRSMFLADFSGQLGAADLWAAPPLAAVNSLADFSLIVLISSSADSARVWLEQTASYNLPAPLLAVVSAAAEPMLRPYAEADAQPGPAQIDGLVSGLVGAAQYEQQAGLPAAGSSGRWAALAGGLIAAVLLVAGSNAVRSVLHIMRRKT